MKVLFSKKLSKTDLRYRLAFPTKHLRVLGIPAGQHSIEIEAIDDSTERTMSFRVSKRILGRYPKPVVSKGWIPFARGKGLQVNDEVTFYSEANEVNRARLRIQVKKKPRIQEKKKPFTLFGQTIWA